MQRYKGEQLDIQKYLDRINYHDALEQTLDTLQALHEAHLLAVPFENLDIHCGRETHLDEPTLFTKIVENRRGGFCYELNGLFAALLTALGYKVTFLSAEVARDDGEFSPAFDHLALLVHLEENWLVDVGFGDSFLRPVQITQAFEQVQGEHAYRFERSGDYWILQYKEDSWKSSYRFTLYPYKLTDFVERCRFHQSAPESHFTQKRVCTLATLSGRVTLSEQKLIVTTGKERQERLLKSQDEYLATLAEQFGIFLSLEDGKHLTKNLF